MVKSVSEDRMQVVVGMMRLAMGGYRTAVHIRDCKRGALAQRKT